MREIHWLLLAGYVILQHCLPLIYPAGQSTLFLWLGNTRVKVCLLGLADIQLLNRVAVTAS